MPDKWLQIDWAKLFLPDVSPLEIFVRGSVLYLVLFALFRVVPKRQMGGLGVSDLLVVVLIAEAVSEALGGESTSVASGLILVLTIMFWNYALNWLDYRVPGFHRVYRARTIPLVKDGVAIRRNMEREFITTDELMSHLRVQGVDDLKRVREACLEADGRISIVTDGTGGDGREAPEPAAK